MKNNGSPQIFWLHFGFTSLILTGMKVGFIINIGIALQSRRESHKKAFPPVFVNKIGYIWM